MTAALGTTSDGGANGYGSVFEIAKTAGGYATAPTTLVNFTIANLTEQTGSLAIHGPVNTTSDQLGPGDADTVKVQLKTGNYEASVDGIAVRPFNFTVGPERPSGQNDLLLP